MQEVETFIQKEFQLSSESMEEIRVLSKTEALSFLGAFEKQYPNLEAKILEQLSTFYKVPKIELEKKELSPSLIECLPRDLAQKFKMLPIERAGNNLIVAMSDPSNVEAIDSVRFRAGYFIKPVFALEGKILEALEKFYGKMDLSRIKDSSSSFAGLKNQSTQIRQVIGGTGGGNKEDGPIIKLVNEMMIKCLQSGASDIHIENYEDSMRIRMRIDGALVEMAKPPLNVKSSLISRIKILAGLNIAESRLPQDGAINIAIGEKPLDFRVSSLPTSYGEKIVLRILDKSNLKVDMTQLGFEEDQLKNFQEAIHSPHGMVLVTGPTGSGKTTTLYSALQELNKEEANIITAEDPVEYSLTGINQVQMKSDIGLTFSTALRAFLRQDPDIIMVGEVRDLETAEIAIKAALTGHLVISTLHTNSAADTISRLLNMGLASFNLVAALRCVTAQRLLKKICQRCKQEDKETTPAMLQALGVPAPFAEKFKAYKGGGCSQCAKTGYKGRIAVHEVMMLDEALKRAILRGDSAMDFKQLAMEAGMRSLRQSALTKLLQGITSAAEVVRVTASDVGV